MNNIHVKDNRSGYPDMLQREVEGLSLLARYAQGTGIAIPTVFSVSNGEMKITGISAGTWSDDAWGRLGAGLAKLHGHRQESYGFDRDSYIGLNPQKNVLCGDWGLFFTGYRLGVQVDMIADTTVREQFAAILASAGDRLSTYLNDCCDYASPVHGDLWRGNVLCDSGGGVWLIDPAVYFGDREVDLAMSEMFGGFGGQFYAAYSNILPLSPEYPRKREIYNLYHYLNHYNLFGDSYLGGCERGFQVVAAL